MKSRNRNAAQFTSHNTLLANTSPGLLVRIGACLILVALMAGVFLVGSTASSLDRSLAAAPGNQSAQENSRFASSAGMSTRLRAPLERIFLPAPRPFLETIETFAADCTTAKSSFVVGETVCAKTNGVTLGAGRFVNWLAPGPVVAHGGSGVTDITTNPQTFSYAPTVTGTWKVTIATPTDISETPAVFTVTAPSPLATYAYAAGCTTTPKSTFNLNETVCATVAGIDPALNRRLFWVGPEGSVRKVTLITSDPQTDSFPLPEDETSIIGGEVVDNRGVWKVNVVSSRGTLLVTVPFSVLGLTPSADLSIAKQIVGAEPQAGALFTYAVYVTNLGPNDATNVVVTDPQPENAMFDSILQTAGPTTPGFSCLGSNPVVCTRPLGLAVGDLAKFEITYKAGAGGSHITNTATVTSDTAEINTADNTTTYGPIQVIGEPGSENTCSLGCPSDMIVSATSAAGAIVTFGNDVEVSGTCGSISFSPASGTQFAVGTTPVNVTSSEGGGSCSFSVTVVNSPAPAITCPLPILTAQAPTGATETTVSVSTPSATGTCVKVTSSRDDDAAVGDKYPVGTTVITWTATEILANCPPPVPSPSDPPPVYGRTVSCTQTVVVTAPAGDLPTITCPSDKTFDTANCAYTATTAEIAAFTPTTTGNLATFDPPAPNPAAVRSDHLALTAPFPAGVTVITWTATDTVGRVVSCSQNITVNSTGDATPPIFTFVPPDISVTTTSCSEVLDDELGVATAEDACSAVSITRTGVPLFSCPIPGDLGRMCESFVFPVGTTNIVYTATDASGHSTSATQHVTVHESTPPTFTFVPADVGPFNNDPGLCGAFVGDATLGTATVADNCDTTVIRSGVPAGNIFPVGDTVITYAAKADLSVTRTQHVTVVDNTPPVVTSPGAVTLYTGSGATSCGVTVTDLDVTLGTGSATDNCPGVGAVTRSGVPEGNVFPLGPTTLTYSATDAHGNTGSATQVVTVVDNTPPIVTPPAAVTLYTGAGATSCSVTVSDLNVTLGTGSATDNCPGVGAVTRSGVPAGNVFPFGPTTLTYSATDAHGNTSSATQIVTVVDNTPPVITLNGQTPSMWPPNHKYQTFGVTNFVTGVTDNCDGAIPVGNVVITKVTSDEIENGNGDGNTLNDIVIAADCKSVQLRSEREGGSNGRVYTIYFSVVDSHGNVGTATAKVVVQHNPGETAVDSGVHYTVCCHGGTCP